MLLIRIVEYMKDILNEIVINVVHMHIILDLLEIKYLIFTYNQYYKSIYKHENCVLWYMIFNLLFFNFFLFYIVSKLGWGNKKKLSLMGDKFLLSPFAYMSFFYNYFSSFWWTMFSGNFFRECSYSMNHILICKICHCEHHRTRLLVIG